MPVNIAWNCRMWPDCDAYDRIAGQQRRGEPVLVRDATAVDDVHALHRHAQLRQLDRSRRRPLRRSWPGSPVAIATCRAIELGQHVVAVGQHRFDDPDERCGLYAPEHRTRAWSPGAGARAPRCDSTDDGRRRQAEVAWRRLHRHRSRCPRSACVAPVLGLTRPPSVVSRVHRGQVRGCACRSLLPAAGRSGEPV